MFGYDGARITSVYFCHFPYVAKRFTRFQFSLGALAYAELGTAIPQSGGEHAYLMYTFGRRKSGLGAIPAFLFDWVYILSCLSIYHITLFKSL